MDEFPEIPGCEILSVLGEGGVAKVYLCIQKKLDRKVAIKVLEPSLLKQKVTEKRFEEEARTAAKLAHSNIIQVYDTGKAGKYHYIIMEYLERSLKDLMKINPGGKLEPRKAFEIVTAIMKALDYAHNKKVYHRDIKPANIMFRPDDTPVLVDFGIARIFDTPSELSKSGQSMGTVYYMSPEQARAKKEIDGRTDIYSLGIVLYEMLTGKKPYEGDSYVSVVLKHIEEPVPKLPPELNLYQPLIDKMMAKDPNKRISNKKEFLELLDDITDVELPFVKFEKELTRKYTLKEKLEFVTLGVLIIVLVLIWVYHIWDSRQKKEHLFQEKYKQAYNYLEKGDFDKAEALLKQLKEVKRTLEVKWLERSIHQYKDTKHDDHLDNAKTYLLQKDLSKAKESLFLAKQLKNTSEVDTLEKRINKKEERIDDHVYKLDRIKNTIVAHQKYLEQFPSGHHIKEVTTNLGKLEEAERRKRKLWLRDEYKELDDIDVRSMIEKQNFFESKLNKSGASKGYYVKVKKKKASVVIDFTTGLMWYDGKTSKKMNFSKAKEWVKELNHQNYGGYNDWRFPSLEEAASLLSNKKNQRGLYLDPIFLGRQAKIWTRDFGSKKVIFLGETILWVVSFDSGRLELSSTKNELQVLPVRSLVGGTSGEK